MDPRHHQIQEDQGQFVAVVADRRQCFGPVCGGDDFIFVCQDLAEDLPVDHFVVDDQHQMFFVNQIKGFIPLLHDATP